MKKLTFLACAAMLTSAVVFTGCKNEDEPKANAPKITTDIAISLPGQLGANGARHMPGVTVQKGGQTDFDLNGGMTNMVLIPFAKAQASGSSERYGENITLGEFSAADVSQENASGRTMLYENQQVPMGTSAFIFYAKSKKTSGNVFEVGQLNATYSGNPSAYHFDLQPICSNVTPVTTIAEEYEAYLTQVANAVDTLYSGAAWKNITAAQNQGYYDMFQAYKDLNALSTFGVERMMTDLFQSLKPNTDSLAKAIRKAIITTYADTVAGKVVLKSSMQNFPQQFNIPVGSVSVAYDGTEGQFGSNAAHAYGGLAPAGLNHYVYPAQLWYYANTLIKTSPSSKKDQYTAGSSWKAILDKYENDNATVNTKTKSIALKDTIQYAVARLDVAVKMADGTTLQDNNPTEGLRTITTPSGGYPLKAVLVGSQKNVGFNFEPLSSSDVYVIYDTVMTTTINAQHSPDTYSAYNSTLVLETKANSDAGDNADDVFVVLEFINKGGDFYGVDQQMIPAGGRFYMVGQLKAAQATETDYKVFKQDFTTIARFNIKNLTKAYNTIPDLKAPQLEIGMSVDLTWRAGHTYDIDIE